jgi:hypothetical protein
MRNFVAPHAPLMAMRGNQQALSYLRRLTEQGMLAVEASQLAARQFLDLCKNRDPSAQMLGDRILKV